MNATKEKEKARREERREVSRLTTLSISLHHLLAFKGLTFFFLLGYL